MKTKKGAAELIAYVLLIGFTIALAALVTNWVVDQTKKFNPEDVVGGSKTYCEDVTLEIEKIEGTLLTTDPHCSGGILDNTNDGKITLKNKGKFTIINVKALGAYIGTLGTGGIKPGSDPVTNTVITSIGFCKEKGINIEIIPQIEVEGKKTYCGQNSAIINDDTLASIQAPAS